jgi:proline iminopeptidase
MSRSPERETLYEPIEPYDHGLLDVGDGNLVYWEVCGNPQGKPAIVTHGGPGSGCVPWWRRLFDPGAYRVVLFDQRNCGRSRPHASAPEIDLSTNTTPNLVADIEQLREHLGIDRWLLLGGSWGSTLALTYAERHPDRVTEMVLFGVTTGRRLDFDWLFRGGLAILFPEQWERFRAAVRTAERDGDLVEAYHRLLHDPDPNVRAEAATEWCMWESATPEWPPTTELSPRFANADFALAFARLVTHYARNDAFLENDEVLNHADTLASIPATMVNGRFDLQAPIGGAWQLAQVWPGAKLVIVDNAGHSPNASVTEELIRATDLCRSPTTSA